MVGRKKFFLLKKINTLIQGLYSIFLFHIFLATVSMLRTDLRDGINPLPSSSGSSIPLYLHMTMSYDQMPRQHEPRQPPRESSRVVNLQSSQSDTVCPQGFWQPWFTSGLRRLGVSNAPNPFLPEVICTWSYISSVTCPSWLMIVIHFGTLAFGSFKHSKAFSPLKYSIPEVTDRVPCIPSRSTNVIHFSTSTFRSFKHSNSFFLRSTPYPKLQIECHTSLRDRRLWSTLGLWRSRVSKIPTPFSYEVLHTRS